GEGGAVGWVDTGRAVGEGKERVLSANAYISTFALAEALDTGADVVITGRCTDPGLTLAPMIHEFGWKAEEWDRLAAGTVAGHIIECGAQTTGGNYTRWWEGPALELAGYPVVEPRPSRELVVAKQPPAARLVDVA